MKKLFTVMSSVAIIAILFASCNSPESDPYIYYDAFYTTRNVGEGVGYADYYQSFAVSSTSSMSGVSVSGTGLLQKENLEAQNSAKNYYKKEISAIRPTVSETYTFNISMSDGDTYQKYDLVSADNLVDPAIINRSTLTTSSDTIFVEWDTIPNNNRDYFNISLEKDSSLYFNFDNGYAIPDTTTQCNISTKSPFWKQEGGLIPSGDYLLTLYTYKLAAAQSGGTGINCIGMDTMTISIP
ncbi:MAG: hypothetical protein ACK5L5_03695 [Bacteroidales bacterium]